MILLTLILAKPPKQSIESVISTAEILGVEQPARQAENVLYCPAPVPGSTHTPLTQFQDCANKLEVVKKLDKFIQDENKSQEQIQKIVSSINCKYYHGSEIFIGADSTLWPCCFLYDSDFNNRDGIREKYSTYPDNWNDLNTYTIDQILSTDYYQRSLRDSWDPSHNLHISRCIRTCAENRSYQNEIIYSQ